MPRPPEPARVGEAGARSGLALLLRPARVQAQGGPEETQRLRAVGQSLGRLLGEGMQERYGLRAGFAFDANPSAPDPTSGVTLRFSGPEGVAQLWLAQATLFALVEAMFGGDGSAPACRENRAASDLERGVVAGLAPFFSEALGEALGLTEIAFSRFAGPDESLSGATGIDLRIRLIGRDGRLSFTCPAAWLGLDAAPRPQGESRRPPELDDVPVSLRVSLVDPGRPIGDVLGLVEGMILPLQIAADAPALVEAEGIGLFHATLGQNAGRYTIRLDAALSSRETPAGVSAANS